MTGGTTVTCENRYSECQETVRCEADVGCIYRYRCTADQYCDGQGRCCPNTTSSGFTSSRPACLTPVE
jgi:hypothetical protein